MRRKKMTKQRDVKEVKRRVSFVFPENDEAEKIKMVFKSAYQRSYRQPKWDDFKAEEFQRKLQYRTDRRSVEHQHQAWLWDSDDEEDVEEIPMDHAEKVNREVVPKQAQPDGSERQHSVQAWVDEQQDICGKERVRDDGEKELRESEQKEIKHRDRKEALDEAEQRPERRKHRERRHKHQSPDRKPQTHDQKKEKTPESPSRVQDVEEKKKHPPFLAYGWANDAPTEFRKTHNVLASDPEVYPAALRASKRRQNIIQQKVKLHEEAIKKKELIAPLAEEGNALFLKEMWLTEYQRNFCKADDLKRHFGR